MPKTASDPAVSIEIINPWHHAAGGFIAAINELQHSQRDGLSLGIPAWALYDCAESTGAIVGFSAGSAGSNHPVSMLAATPAMREGSWHFYALCAHNSSLLKPTIDLAVELLRPREITAVLGWGDGSLGAYIGLGRGELVTAWTPAHTVAASATIRVVPGGAATAGGVVYELDTSDERSLRSLQREIEGGACYEFSDPPGEEETILLEKRRA